MYDLATDLAQRAVHWVMELRTYPAPNPQTAAARPKIIAHRGCWDLSACRENTLAAFRKAEQLGADGIEFDIHFTEDNIPVVMHDPDLQRTHRQAMRIREIKHSRLRELTPSIPTLEEVLALKNLHFMIEVKLAMNAKQLDVLTQMLMPLNNYHLMTLEREYVRTNSRISPRSWILIGYPSVRDLVADSLSKGYGGVSGHYLFLTADLQKRLHAAKQIVGVGFVDTRNLYHREWQLGRDYVFTNSLQSVVSI